MATTPTQSIVGPEYPGADGDNWNGWLSNMSDSFDYGVNDLNQKVTAALSAMTQNPSDPVLLAKYQTSLSEYTLYRNAQSNTVKAFKDIDSAIIQNFR